MVVCTYISDTDVIVSMSMPCIFSITRSMSKSVRVYLCECVVVRMCLCVCITKSWQAILTHFSTIAERKQNILDYRAVAAATAKQLNRESNAVANIVSIRNIFFGIFFVCRLSACC